MTEPTVIDVLVTICQAFWITIPAYLPNSMAVIFGGGTPMDFGKVMKDGRRVLGKGKTWGGFFGGGMSGFVIGFIQILMEGNYYPPEMQEIVWIQFQCD